MSEHGMEWKSNALPTLKNATKKLIKFHAVVRGEAEWSGAEKEQEIQEA